MYFDTLELIITNNSLYQVQSFVLVRICKSLNSIQKYYFWRQFGCLNTHLYSHCLHVVVIFSCFNTRRSSVGTFIGRQQTETKEPKERKPPAPKLDIRSMVDVDEMPDLFRSIDRKYML